jgi:hypothetical protein
MRMLAVVLMLLPTASAVQGQAYINQTALKEVLEGRRTRLDRIPEVEYDYYVLDHPSGNSVAARNTFYKIIGQGDSRVGFDRSKLVEIINRRLLEEVELGDTLIVPANPQMYGLDFRAYSPFPHYYAGGRQFEKLFIIDKSVQAFAAYENGQLVRWGAVNTGAPSSPTPTGRYNFNWKEPYRVSSLSPPGEPWEMYWVFNIHDARGIHIHQYAMPTGGPTSHGCVRLIDADAEWIYNWGDTWERSGSRIVKQGTTVLVVGKDPEGAPLPFEFRRRYPILRQVELPADPYDVPPASSQQEYFDRMRLSASR